MDFWVTAEPEDAEGQLETPNPFHQDAQDPEDAFFHWSKQMFCQIEQW